MPESLADLWVKSEKWKLRSLGDRMAAIYDSCLPDETSMIVPAEFSGLRTVAFLPVAACPRGEESSGNAQ